MIHSKWWTLRGLIWKQPAQRTSPNERTSHFFSVCLALVVVCKVNTRLVCELFPCLFLWRCCSFSEKLHQPHAWITRCFHSILPQFKTQCWHNVFGSTQFTRNPWVNEVLKDYLVPGTATSWKTFKPNELICEVPFLFKYTWPSDTEDTNKKTAHTNHCTSA